MQLFPVPVKMRTGCYGFTVICDGGACMYVCVYVCEPTCHLGEDESRPTSGSRT